MVRKAYRTFSPQMEALAARVLDERHVDAAIRPGKIGGAYCYSVLPGQTPYVLLNFKGDVRDIATLAHELGHAVHGMLAGDHSVFTFHSTLPLAETGDRPGPHGARAGLAPRAAEDFHAARRGRLAALERGDVPDRRLRPGRRDVGGRPCRLRPRGLPGGRG